MYLDRKIIVGAIAVVAIVGALTSIYLTQVERAPKVNVKPYKALGAVVAEETSKLLGHKGRVVVLAADAGKFQIPALQSQMESFKRALAKKRGLTIAAIEKVDIPMGTLMQLGSGGFAEPSLGLSPDQVMRVLAAHPGIDALVSFVGFPPLPDQAVTMLRQRPVKVVVVSSHDPWLGGLLQAQIIHVAIVPRSGAPPVGAPKKPRTLQEWFDQTYLLVTPEKAERLL